MKGTRHRRHCDTQRKSKAEGAYVHRLRGRRRPVRNDAQGVRHDEDSARPSEHQIIHDVVGVPLRLSFQFLQRVSSPEPWVFWQVSFGHPWGSPHPSDSWRTLSAPLSGTCGSGDVKGLGRGVHALSVHGLLDLAGHQPIEGPCGRHKCWARSPVT